MASFTSIGPTTLLAPVPAVMVSCARPGERPNIVTVAWAGVVCSQPPMVSISLRKERYSHAIISETGEFVINLVDQAHCADLDYCGVKSGRDIDKFAERHLTPVAADGLTCAPAIGECPAYLSCKVRQVVELGSHDMFIAEVKQAAVQNRLMNADNSVHLERADLVCYDHGLYHAMGDVMGFFGYSVARPEVYERRMQNYRK